MHKAGAIILGVGGDNADRKVGSESTVGTITHQPQSKNQAVQIPGMSIGTHVFFFHHHAHVSNVHRIGGSLIVYLSSWSRGRVRVQSSAARISRPSHVNFFSVRGTGTFYEGLLTVGLTTDASDNAVQANIVAAGYGK